MNKRESKKEAILLAGMDVMKVQGYNGTSVKDIVSAASVPKGSFYNYFESKEQFALDAIEYAGAASLDYARIAFGDSSQCAFKRLKTFFIGGADCACDNNFTVGCFLGNMCQEMADVSDTIRAKLDSVLSRYTKVIVKVIEEGQAGGSVKADLVPETAAEFLFNAWEGALMRAKASKSRVPLDAFVDMLHRVLV